MPWDLPPGVYIDVSVEMTLVLIPSELASTELATPSHSSQKHYSYHDMITPESFIASLDDLEAYIEAEGPFDGVVAYSQGAGLVATLLVRRQYLRPKQKCLFRCAVLFSPAQVYNPVTYAESGEVKVLDKMPDGVMTIHIPMAIIHGKADDKLEECRRVESICDPGLLSVFVHEGGHEVPGLGARDGVPGAVRAARRAIITAELSNNFQMHESPIVYES